MAKRILAVLVIVLGLVGLLAYSQWRPAAPKVSGFIEAHEIRIGSRVGGRVRTVPAEEGAKVEPGAALVTFEPYDLMERQAEAKATLAARDADYQRLAAGYRPEEVAQAKARRDRLAANYDKLKAGPRRQEIAQAEAQLALAKAQRQTAQASFDRVKRLYERDQANASQEEMDRVTDALQVAEATLNVRQEELSKLREGTRAEELQEAAAQLAEAEAALAMMQKGYRTEEITQAKAAAEAARAAVQAIDQQVAELTITAPSAAMVEAVELRPGDLLAANAPALTLIDPKELWVRAYVPENRLDLATGQKVRVTVDSFPGRNFTGRVTYVSRNAEFTPGNVQTPEERSKQVFRIKVTLEEGQDVLRPGMTADVWLERGEGR